MTRKSAPTYYTPVWRKLMYQRLAKARCGDFVERALMATRKR